MAGSAKRHFIRCLLMDIFKKAWFAASSRGSRPLVPPKVPGRRIRSLLAWAGSASVKDSRSPNASEPDSRRAIIATGLNTDDQQG